MIHASSQYQGIEASWARRTVEAVKEGGLKVVTILALGAAAATLAGCAPSADADPRETTSASASPNPSPETTKPPEAKFDGVVNYAAFENWAEKDEVAKDTACAEFYGANLPNGIKATEQSNGIQAAQWYAEHIQVLSDLNSDTSDPRNQEVALAIVDCVTSVHTQGADAREDLIGELKAQASKAVDGARLSYIAEVTRYSDGFIPATGSVGGAYDALTIEGYNNASNPALKSLYQGVFEWHHSEIFPAFKLASDARVGIAEGDNVLPSGGKPPIVVDPAFAEAPWS